MLEQESKVQEAQGLNSAKSLIEAFSFRSNNFIDVLYFGKILQNNSLVIWCLEQCSDLHDFLKVRSFLWNCSDNYLVVNYWDSYENEAKNADCFDSSIHR